MEKKYKREYVFITSTVVEGSLRLHVVLPKNRLITEKLTFYEDFQLGSILTMGSEEKFLNELCSKYLGLKRGGGKVGGGEGVTGDYSLGRRSWGQLHGWKYPGYGII